ncbi:pentapeptide repeat-containing protein, partial [Microcoleus sp. herbarium8]|uniref:pentapeptide repeat-containing protein n=1 Tax=Microcoleus sp. herbarium8 TaxID=3055436 RepID=UPI002FD06C82
MKLRQLAAFLLALTIFILPRPALAQSKYYAPPLSFSNAELSRRDFSGQMLRAAEFSNAKMDSTNFSNADLRGAIMSASVM